MKIINQSFEIIDQSNTEIGLFKHIEKACRICYKSEDKITDTSYQRFLNMIRSNGHLSPWEHGTVYMLIPSEYIYDEYTISEAIENTPWTRIKLVDDCWYITTNYRAIIENNLEDIYNKYKCEPTEYHEKRVTVKFITSIGISRELNRHRCHSICEESTRYCNYSKDKFNSELTFIKPNWCEAPIGTYEVILDDDSIEGTFCEQLEEHTYIEDYNTRAYLRTLDEIETQYMYLLDNKCTPQEAREILPLCTKTEVIHTAFVSDWEHFFKLRCSKAAHPMMQELANGLKEEFIKMEYIKN